ncbi:uncharacterized protein LOC125238306 [Leguminivora glycinivorella]|uniref:uncharacterized protein LOC125238306 n=1 Tax=Leguminivora glycinivorella TaxID=1035111 RepID=UPI00200CEA94|nr:uncharacterized protein LOC125238306 [Leguminivora glycinivorella]
MDKLMSFFQPEKRRAKKEEDIEERDVPAVEDRRKWSISRSGRMKQANKKRHSVAKDLYGEACVPVEKPKTLEYHVNIPVKPLDESTKPESPSEPKSPEEEIESAFEILDKVDKIDKLYAS